MRAKAWLGSLALLLTPVWSHALNLGDMELKSVAGEPLEAEIELLVSATDEPSGLYVRVADDATLKRVGIDASPALAQLRFEVSFGPNVRDYVRVYTNEPIREARLHFLLEASWPKGRLFKEYVVQMEAPVYAEDTGEQPVMRPGPVVAAEPPDVSRLPPPAGRSDLADGVYGPVIATDTLWALAMRYRPDRSVSIQQMMLAMLRTNPDAFINDNINWLKKDAFLRMPDEAELRRLTVREAFLEVKEQNHVWREARGLLAAGEREALADTAEESAELRLVAAGATAAGSEGLAAEPVGQTDADALILVTEQVESLTQENAELGVRLEEAESIIEDLRGLVELKDDQLAAVQSQAESRAADEGLLAAAGDLAARLFMGFTSEAIIAVTLVVGLIALIFAVLMVLRRRSEARATRERPVADEDDSQVMKFVAARDPDHERVSGPTVDDAPEAAVDPVPVSPNAPESALKAPAARQEDEAGRNPAGDAGDMLPNRVTDPDDTVPAMMAGIPPGGRGGVADDAAPAGDEEDEAANKIELAKAYLDLGDEASATSILNEVLQEGNPAQREQARQLLQRGQP